MTIKLKGSTDGSVSLQAPADTSPTGTDITLTLPTTAGSANQFVKNSGTAGTFEYSSMVETSTGVGIGTSSPGQKLVVSEGGAQGLEFNPFTSDRFILAGYNRSNSQYIQLEYEGSQHVFKSGGTNERARISDVGHIHIHTTTSFPGSGNTNTGAMIEKASDGSTIFVSRGSNVAGYFNRNDNGTLVRFSRSGTEVGKVQVTTTSTIYATSSDYRLKENVVSISDGITRVKQLAPKRFNFIADADTTVDGFLAHEAQTVVPEAVTGTHNEVDDDGNAVMQGIDQSKLVPLLTAALQEAIAKIETLETKVAALEAGS